MAVSTADSAAKRWQSGMAGASAAYIAGINATTVNPMEKAAEAVDSGYWAQRTMAAAPRMSAKLRSTAKSVWTNGAVTTGAQRLATGAQKGAPKYASAAQKLAPIWQAMHDVVQTMPKGGLGNAQARANAALAVLMQQTGKA